MSAPLLLTFRHPCVAGVHDWKLREHAWGRLGTWSLYRCETCFEERHGHCINQRCSICEAAEATEAIHCSVCDPIWRASIEASERYHADTELRGPRREALVSEYFTTHARREAIQRKPPALLMRLLPPEEEQLELFDERRAA